MDETTRPEPDGASPRRRPGGSESDALDAVRDAFDALVRGPDPLSIEGRLFPRLPDHRLRLDRVRHLMLAPGCRPATRDAVWSHLVLRARTDTPAWKVGAAGMALPALTSITADLTGRFGCDRDDVAGEVLSGFLDGVETVDVSRPDIITRLRWSAARAGNRALLAEATAPLPYGAPQDLDARVRATSGFGSDPPAPPYGHPDLVLAQAVADGVLSRLEADLIGATRLDQVTLTAWADAHAATVWATHQARRLAEQRLTGYLLRPGYRFGLLRYASPRPHATTHRRNACHLDRRCRATRPRHRSTQPSTTPPRSSAPRHRRPTALDRPPSPNRPTGPTTWPDETGGPSCA